MSFAASFAIVSPGGAYTDANGAVQQAPADAPRFDHTAGGVALGLLVQGFPEAMTADQVTLDVGVVPNQGCTILHTYQQPGGAIVSRALWSTRPTETINALLNTKGWHRSLIVVPYALAVADGTVSFRGQVYALPAALAVNQAATEVLGLGDATTSTLLGAE